VKGTPELSSCLVGDPFGAFGSESFIAHSKSIAVFYYGCACFCLSVLVSVVLTYFKNVPYFVLNILPLVSSNRLTSSKLTVSKSSLLACN
jgi:Na+/H+-dicarboxylate symporter